MLGVFRSIFVVASVTMLFGVAGCGSGDASNEVAKSTPSPVPTTTTSTPVGDPDSCEAKGITKAGGKIGTCTSSNGQTLDVVRRNGTVRTDDTDVRLVRSYIVKRVPTLAEYGAPGQTAKGRFAIFHFRVKNTTNGPLSWASGIGTTCLLVGENVYSPSTKTAAFTFAYRLKGDPGLESSEMQPGETADGWVAFDVPAEAASKIKDEGQLGVVSVNDATNGYNAASGSAERSGVIQLWS